MEELGQELRLLDYDASIASITLPLVAVVGSGDRGQQSKSSGLQE